MSTADYAILGIAAYVAVMSLVRLMRERQRQIMQELAGEVRRQKAAPGQPQKTPGESSSEIAAENERKAA